MTAPETSVLVANLRRLGALATQKGAIPTANLVILAAARLEELDAARLQRKANATAGAFARAHALTSEQRSAIARKANQARYGHAST